MFFIIQGRQIQKFNKKLTDHQMFSYLLIISFPIKKISMFYYFFKKIGVCSCQNFEAFLIFIEEMLMKLNWFKFTWDDLDICNNLKKRFICCVPYWMLCHAPIYHSCFDWLNRVPKNIKLCEEKPDNISRLSSSRRYKMGMHLILLRHSQCGIN